MKSIHTVHVSPAIPEKLTALYEIAFDMHWVWNNEAIELFRRLDTKLWREVHHNPIRFLSELAQERLENAAEDEAFINHLEKVNNEFEIYKLERLWYQTHMEEKTEGMLVAYFSAEFGLHECLPIYSGGLGILAGDHLKAASDLGVPLIGVGLLYQRGYFRQYLNTDGWQQENYPLYDFYNIPVRLVRDKKGKPVTVSVDLRGREVTAQIWKVLVGRVTLYLLDTNIIANHADDRLITETLYGGDNEMRIKQEIVLGIGGYRALKALDLNPTVYHMNEGHSAFLGLEKIRLLVENDGFTFEEAREATRARNVFTTHTPVPAGIDRFSQDLMYSYFSNFWPRMGIDEEKFLKLGGAQKADPLTPFNMATMAINLAACVNGVSKLHGEVSRRMWRHLWPDIDLEEIPIKHVTNGVHAKSWISADMGRLFDRYLGPKWQESTDDNHVWERVQDISSLELWRVRERSRERLVAYARRHLQEHLKRRGESSLTVERGGEVLDMNVLTIGFARRFATYKRGSLLFRDPDRLIRLLMDPEHPIQIIIAGKAHPKDEPGKEMIREIVHFARDENVRRRVVFLEDYDINLARYLVQGCDVWLNNPRPPMEASGTSGMKAAVNGVLNCSTYDGWWVEGYSPDTGWKIGQGEEYDDIEQQDNVESKILYDLLEKDIIPKFYKRDAGGVAREWTEMQKSMLEKLCPVFITTRMVREYTENAYVKVHNRAQKMSAKGDQRIKDYVRWKSNVTEKWDSVSIENVIAGRVLQRTVGDTINVEAIVCTGELTPEDICVEVYFGRFSGNEDLLDHEIIPMEKQHQNEDGTYLYKSTVKCKVSGRCGFYVRMLPANKDMVHKLEIPLITVEA